MIVYNVLREFRAHKDEAERIRKDAGLQPTATTKIRIDTRDELAAFLNGLCSLTSQRAADPSIAAPVVEILGENEPPFIPDDAEIPQFIRNDWDRFKANN